MSSAQDLRPIIIKKAKSHAKPHGNHSWKIAYADFMTAMMALFLVLWLLSSASPKTLVGVAEYFKTPLKVAVAGGDKSSLSKSVIPGGGKDPMAKDGEVMKAMTNDPADAQRRRDQMDSERLRALKGRLEQIIDNNPTLRQFRPQLLLDITSEGLRIQILDTQNRPMFRTGSAAVEPYMRAILREIGPVLNEMPNKVSLSGHTDSATYMMGERAYSNWELSADRANASRQELIAGGMQEGKVLRVLGLADTMPLEKNDPMAATNRRISIVVLNKRAQAQFESENASAADVQVQAQKGQMAEQMQTQVEAASGAAAARPASAPKGR